MNTSALAFLSSQFYDKKNSSTFITRRKVKKRKIVGEENGPMRHFNPHAFSPSFLKPSLFRPLLGISLLNYFVSVK